MIIIPLLAFEGSKTRDVTANDIRYQIWNPCITQICNDAGCVCVGGYENHTGSSTVKGVVQASSNKVYVNGQKVAKLNDSVKETEQTHIPSNAVNVSNHEGGTGKIIVGNSNRVYVEGVLAAIVGSQVKTHTSPSTVIETGCKNVYVGS
ncbi:hypothetical protein EEL30_22240 [Brevibacillus laterosporus]|uniref:Uncharacterized protein n=1 Tax=Brevibacillus laterosporus TaxID=1465 RepID=A0A518VCP9_BRELA|nr:hypothetical protein EEL30_22240 [Brevibacillus laterosporus]